MIPVVLKYIGIVLLCIVVTALVLLCLLLFAPFRYCIRGSFHERRADADVSVRWLLGLVSLHGCFHQNAEEADSPGLWLKVLGIRVKRLYPSGEAKEAHAGKAAEAGAQTTPTASAGQADGNISSRQGEGGRTGITCAEKAAEAEGRRAGAMDARNENDIIKITDEELKALKPAKADDAPSDRTGEGEPVHTEGADRKENATGKAAECSAGPERAADGAADAHGAQEAEGEADGGVQEKKNLAAGLAERFKELKNKVSGLINELRNKTDKASALLELYNDPENRKCIDRLKNNVIKVLIELKPRAGKVCVVYGSDDPYTTAEVSQWVILFSPLLDFLEFTPDFAGQREDADADIRGRVRLIALLIPAAKVFFDKKLRRLYKIARHITEDD